MFTEDYLFERSFFAAQSEFFELDSCYGSVENQIIKGGRIKIYFKTIYFPSGSHRLCEGLVAH